MAKHEIIIIADYSQETSLTLDELCELCDISPDFLQDLLAYDIIHPSKQQAFGLAELNRIKTVLRLQRDLEVNLAGAALALDLLDELEELRKRTEIMERYFLRNQEDES